MPDTRIHLKAGLFTERAHNLVEHGSLRASCYQFESGVNAVSLVNAVGELVLLPYQGQQIWSARFQDRELTMQSMFTQPVATREYLETYGAFLVHCGATAMGVPSPQDTHPLHGELPNAPYQKASLLAGSDAQGDFLELSGAYEHIVAFQHHYLAQPSVRLYAEQSVFTIRMTIRNLKNSPMELMYLAHINFRPVDFGRLVYSALPTPDSVRVRRSIPGHVQPKAGYREFLESLAADPGQHHVLKPGLAFDPEVAFFIDYLPDGDGWAHSLQVHPDGSGDYVRHRPAELSHGIRWISRTADQDALGLVEPATAEVEGYTAEKNKGHLFNLPPHAEFNCRIEAGLLSAAETSAVEKKIEDILRKNTSTGG
jgi:hypothetical protein